VAFSLNNDNAFYSLSVPVIGYPFSMTGWFRVPDTTSFLALMGFASLSTGARCDVFYAGDGAKEVVAKSANGSSGSAYSTSPMVPGQWHHLAAVFSSDTERKIYLDGGNVGVNNANIPVGVLNFFYFGAGYSQDFIDVADVSLVAAAFSEDQAAALAKGVSVFALPNSQNVIAYHDCIRDAFRPGLGPVFVSNGTLVVKEHPRMVFPNGGFSAAMPDRIRGPFRIEEALFRSQSAEQGQPSIAGVVSTNPIIPGEVVS